MEEKKKDKEEEKEEEESGDNNKEAGTTSSNTTFHPSISLSFTTHYSHIISPPRIDSTRPRDVLRVLPFAGALVSSVT